ncbi:hypothetical protein AGMMS49949_01430 [Alphaproteobacteria bacterium]|nr:hypothetical protein AGMMS49949_01430 [Alphaproteobacteria bacterium]GHS97063.1 hypothetical protein AGMMS50296_3720 [Alphaproteobacteria bacterium]
MNTKLKILYKPLTELHEYERNPRKNDTVLEKMKHCIQEFGFRIPIVVQSDGTIVDGHLRFKAAKALGLQEVPVVLADELSEAQIKAFRLVANQSANWADWDEELLKLELEDLKNLNFDLDLTGFDLKDIEKFLKDDFEDDFEDDFDAEKATQQNQKIISKRGDLWLLGKHRLLCGDSLDPKQVATLMNGFKVDTVFTDPPYDFTECSYASILKDFSEDANVFVMNNDPNMIRYLRQSQLDFRKFFIADFVFASPQGSEPYLSHILVSHEKNGNAKSNKNLRDGLRSLIRMEYRGNLTDEKTIHTHQKSLKFITTFLKHYQATSVLDIFGGSGSTLIACENLGIPCFMLEIEPLYVDVILQRWEALTKDKALLEADGLTFSEVQSLREASC